MLELPGWPADMRVTVRKERPHPGAPLRFTDRDGLRLTACVTDTRTGQLPDVELRHRRRARCEHRIRAAKHRAAQSSTARIRPEPNLVRDRPTRHGTDRRDADARPA